MCWKEFEEGLRQEFIVILSHFDRIKNVMNEDTRKDFLGLLQYILTDRSSFRPIALHHGIDIKPFSEAGSFDNPNCNAHELAVELLEKELDSFAHEFSHFPYILANHSDIPEADLIKLCCKYWKHRYPSVKTSFIIPLATKLPTLPEASELRDLLTRRILKGKLEPFDDSIKVCELLGIPPEALEFHDMQLAALKDLLHNHQQLKIEDAFARQQTGCHCD